MTISIKHKFVNPKSDTADGTVTRASNWNDEHELTLAQNRVLGRISAANGPVEELTGDQIRTISDTTQAGVVVGVNTRTAPYTLVASDRGKIIEMNVAGANTVTIPNETGIGGVNFPIGTLINVVQLGTGQTTLLPAAGVTARSVTGGLSTSTRYGSLILYKRASNDWFVIDQTSAYLDGRVDTLETIAGGLADVGTVATDIASVTTVAGSIGNVNIAATNVADINNFADVYQGGNSSDPTLRNSGSTLQTGDLYYNTVNNRMRVYETGAGWIDYEATAQTAATTATTQAGIATTQAGTATAQAGIATTQATIAATQAGLAATAKTAAETARDAAFANADVYASIATGRAAVADGQQFMVVDGDKIVRYRRDSASTQTEVARYPTSELAAVGGSITQGVYPATSGTVPFGSNLTLYNSTPVSDAGVITPFSVYLGASATGVRFILASIVGSVATLQEISQEYSLAAGLNTISDWAPQAQAGWFVGVYAPTGVIVGNTGGSSFYHSGIPGASTAVSTTSGPLSLGWIVNRGPLSEKKRALIAEAAINEKINGSTDTYGTFPASGFSTYLGDGFTSFSEVAIPTAGLLSRVSATTLSGGDFKLVLATKNASHQFTFVASLDIAATAATEKTYAWGYPVTEAQVAAGLYVGVYTPTGKNGVGYAAQAGSSLRYVTGIPGTNSASGNLSGNKAAIGFEVISGITPRQEKLELDVFAGASVLSSIGIGLLDDADATGVSDATAIFAAARTIHETPEVPKGNFSVTSIPHYGEGFWGTGKIAVNGVTMSLPRAPENGARYLKLRSAFGAQISTKSALIVSGDSITTGQGATSNKTTWLGLLTRFVNMGIALDEPVMSYFSNSPPSMTLEGLTLTSPTTLTTGTNGPSGQSLILAVGQSLVFTGLYERVDVTYTGVASGALTFAFNGSTYATVTCATTGDDVLAAAGATGQASSGTYTITNTGSVPVEITSLMRFAPLTAGTQRLFVCRFSVSGGSTNSVTASRVASMLRVATAIEGGTNHTLISAYGTNDIVAGVRTYAQVRSDFETYTNAWISAGITTKNILAVLPWEWSSYPSGRSFEWVGAIRDGYKAAGITRFAQTDSLPIVSLGLGAHPNDEGYYRAFNTIVDAICSEV